MYHFRFDVEPKPKERPRRGKFGFYTPKRTKDAESAIAALARAQFKESPLEGPLSARVWFYFARPKTNKDKYCTNRVDLDNICKLVFDSLNGLVYKDDRQIVRMTASKEYSDSPRIELVLYGKE